MGLTRRAMKAYEDLKISTIETTDAKALFARLLKDCAFAIGGAKQTAALIRAADAYRCVFEETNSFFPAVNAASLYALAGKAAVADEIATRIARESAELAELDYYDFATLAEAHVILGNYTQASDALRKACDCADAGISERAGTFRQIDRLLAHAGVDKVTRAQVLEALRPGAALFYCGRMFQEDAQIEDGLIQQIDAFIAQHKIAAGFGSLACGADIMITERLLHHSIPVFVTLAAPVKDFIDVSVRNGGSGWVTRFHTCLEAAQEVHVASDGFHTSDPLAFSLTSDVAMGQAARFAELNVCSLHQIAILGGADAAGSVAGTNADIDNWTAFGRASTTIRVDGITRPAAANAPETDDTSFKRRAVSLLFADFAGFSALPDQSIPDLVTRALNALADELQTYGKGVLLQNTWGDACFAAFESPTDAARAAFSLIQKLGASDMLEAVRGLRISLHHGIAMEVFDPVLAGTTISGKRSAAQRGYRHIAYASDRTSAQLSAPDGLHRYAAFLDRTAPQPAAAS